MSRGIILPILIGIAVLGLIGILSPSYAQAEQEETTLPDWFENNHTWLDNKQIDDELFLQAMQYLIDNDLIKTQKDSMTHKFASTVNNVISNNNLEGVEHFVHFAADSNFSGCEETNSCLVPHTITINVGDRVTWSTDYGLNTISAGDLFVDPDLVGEDYPNGFYSDLMLIHTTFTHQFDTEGTYPYFSFVHPWASGVVIVEPNIEEPQDKTCVNETISNEIFKSITITDNSICILDNVVVLKNIKVLNSQFTRISNSHVEGSIIINNSFDNGSIVIENSLIEKNVKMTESDPVFLQIFGSTINKNLIIKDQIITEVSIDASQIGQNVHVTNNIFEGSFEFENNIVFGNIILKNNVGNDLIVLQGNSFGKNVKVLKNDINDTIEVTLNTIQGNLEMKNNNIDELEVGGNIIGKKMQINKNQLQFALAMNANEVNQNINISKNTMNQFFISYNISDLKIKLTSNVIETFFGCGNNSPNPIMKKNTFAGQDLDECTIVGNS